MKTLLAFLELVRPRQWTKNLVVFAGLIFSANLFHGALLLKTFAAFGTVCLAAGAVYIYNDIHDRERDRHHPQKKYRPLASGKVRVETASVVAGGLLLLSLGWSFWLSPGFGLVILSYLLLNFVYTLGVKKFVILDVFTISAGFVLRAVGGAVVIAVEISPWLLVVTSLLSLFLGFAKRRHELVTMGAKAVQHRVSLEEYSPGLLDQFLNVLASSTIIAYSLYAFTSTKAQEHHALMLTVPFVLYGLLRYLYLIYQKQLGGSPELILLKDKPLMITILLWTITAVVIMQRG